MIKQIVLILSFIFSCFYIIAQTNSGSDLKQSDLKSGLVFKSASENRKDDSTYTDTIQLINLNGTAQALQFKIFFNKSFDDSQILLFKSIQKGSDISDSAWLLEYNILPGSSNSNVKSKDEIFVLLYNSNFKDGLLPGSYYSLFEINYEVIDLPKAKNNVKSSISISYAEASAADGNKINVASKQNELKIFVTTK